MVVFVLAFVMTIGLMLISRGLDSTDGFLRTYYTVYVLGFLGIAGVIAGVVKEVLDHKAERDMSMKIITGHGIAVTSAVLAISMFLILFGGFAGSIRLLYVAIPALAVLYLIYMIYPHEFSALATVGGAMALYFWRFAQYNRGTLRFYLKQSAWIVILLALAALLYVLKKTDGEIAIRGKKVRLLAQDAEYIATFAFLAVFLLIIAAAFILPANMILSLAYVTLAVIFIMAVYYAVRMM